MGCMGFRFRIYIVAEASPLSDLAAARAGAMRMMHCANVQCRCVYGVRLEIRIATEAVSHRNPAACDGT